MGITLLFTDVGLERSLASFNIENDSSNGIFQKVRYSPTQLEIATGLGVESKEVL
jgi:hypothetical protein